MKEKRKHPEIGFLGLALLTLGLILACGHSNLAAWFVVVGGIVLAVALFTGNVKLFG